MLFCPPKQLMTGHLNDFLLSLSDRKWFPVLFSRPIPIAQGYPLVHQDATSQLWQEQSCIQFYPEEPPLTTVFENIFRMGLPEKNTPQN